MRAAVVVLLAAAGTASCANESPLHEPASPQQNSIQVEPGQKFDAEHRWEIADPIAIRKLQGTRS